jgi:adenylyltransferase/sulfurtransferase
LIDPDHVEISNLHRQLWQRTGDLGRPKVACAAERIAAAFPGVKITARQDRVTPDLAEALFQQHQLVVDGTDDWRVKLALSDAAVRSGVPLVYGGVLRMSGQAMVVSREGVCLRCLFEEPEALPSCAQAGVLGSLAGATGALQALLGLQVLAGRAPSEGALVLLDGERFTQRVVAVRRARDCRHE